MNLTAVITGVSHSRGIGAAICTKLAKDGINIFFTHWQADLQWIEDFQAELETYGVHCAHMEIDLSEHDAATSILNVVTDRIGFPTILVNNAAHSTNDGFLQLDADALDKHYAVNMRSTFLLSVEFARRLSHAKNSYGRIINLTSGQDLGPMPNELAYAATKGAISAFTRSLSAEVAHLHITVNAVNPGPTDTGWMTENIETQLRPKFPQGRIGTPNDAANIISFLASEEAQWITGQIIHSEGGFLRR
ncbi:SDR family oxidoreductase [Bacillus sp. HMF5848]|uniref:SDR family oxidoreductase n=1 Tax=Bacillus sp. HMF5848 TaxID=2495421 RepID=UPI000F78F4DD|nr:SDR family oxidoreductase [Bacillus sp. HMF5848]RSK26644.1 SDR family oxidoreductase [Bacillus sp. HMF5848]